MNIFKKFRQMPIINLLLFVLLMVTSCEMFDHDNAYDPISPKFDVSQFPHALYKKEDGEHFLYEPSGTPGITVYADFTPYHKDGEPYGTWVMNATWRDKPRHTIVELTVPVAIDANGQGIASLPPWFLDKVFEEAYTRYMATKDDPWPDADIWHHSPGLYLNFYTDNEGYGYYSFNGCPSGWNFGGSLNELVDQLGLSWWPGLDPLQGVGVRVSIPDPLTLKDCEADPSETPAPPAPCEPEPPAPCEPEPPAIQTPILPPNQFPGSPGTMVGAPSPSG